MKFADWKIEREHIERMTNETRCSIEGQLNQLGDQQLRLDASTRRDWKVTDKITITVCGPYFYMTVVDDSRFGEHTVNLVGLSDVALAMAIAAIHARERWITGEIDELPAELKLTRIDIEP